MAIHKIYPNLICAGCGNELVYTEPETKHVFTLKVVPCPKCAAQQSVQADGGVCTCDGGVSDPEDNRLCGVCGLPHRR